MKIKSLLLATMALAITADAAANVEMSIFKKKKKKCFMRNYLASG